MAQLLAAAAIPGSASTEEVELTIHLQVWRYISLGCTLALLPYWYLSHVRVVALVWTTVAAVIAIVTGWRSAAIATVTGAFLNAAASYARDHFKDDLEGLKKNIKTFTSSVDALNALQDLANINGLSARHRTEVACMLEDMSNTLERLHSRRAGMCSWFKGV